MQAIKHESDLSTAGILTVKCDFLCDIFSFDVIFLVGYVHIAIISQLPAIFIDPLPYLRICKQKVTFVNPV